MKIELDLNNKEEEMKRFRDMLHTAISSMENDEYMKKREQEERAKRPHIDTRGSL